MEKEEDSVKNGSNHRFAKMITTKENAKENSKPVCIYKMFSSDERNDCNHNDTVPQPYVNYVKNMSEGSDDLKEEILDLSIHSKCKSEGENSEIDEANIESIKNDDEDSVEGCSETKDEILDLTVHCESRLSELDDSGEDVESLALDEECVDPLEFLEVDQYVAAESSDGEDSKEEVGQPAAPLATSTTQESSEQLTVENNGLSQDDTQASLNQRLPAGFIICEKCGYLKSIRRKRQKPTTESLDSSKKQVLCICDSDKFKCKLCNKYIKVIAYDFHMSRHRRARDQYKCEFCLKTFLDSSNLRNHKLIIHEGHKYSCDTCGKSFHYIKSLKCHLASCSKKRYKCNVCGESFSTKRPLLSHLRTHEVTKSPEETTNICEICCIVFDNSRSKKDHIVEVHVAAQRFVCGTCGEAFVTESSMKRHKASHERSYSCKMCDAKFSAKRDLRVHVVGHRKKLQSLTCKSCGEQFDTTDVFIEHKTTQKCKDNTKVCEICNKNFKDSTSLKKHQVVHTPFSERSVKCDICERSFSGPSALKKHIRLIHADARPYTCEFCSKSFNQLCKLKYHIVSHASDKPVTCDICNKGFSSDKDIKIHMLTHTGEKPFKCNICGKSFRQRGHVKTHQLVHTREKPYSCHICNKSFGLPSSLKKHLKLHSSSSSIIRVNE